MRSRNSNSNLVYRFFVEEEKRTSLAYGTPEHPDHEHWKLLNYVHQVKSLAERRMRMGRNASARSSGDELALRCHELLDTLLETIGIHAHEKDLILERLSLRLRGPGRDGNLVAAEIQSDSNQHLLERTHPVEISHASYPGVVTEHLRDAAVIRFNVGGESEEREFFWSDLSVQPESLPVGALVRGETRLFLAPDLPAANEVRQDMRRIQEEVEKELEIRGIDPQSPIGSLPDDTMRQRSGRAWRDDGKP